VPAGPSGCPSDPRWPTSSSPCAWNPNWCTPSSTACTSAPAAQGGTERGEGEVLGIAHYACAPSGKSRSGATRGRAIRASGPIPLATTEDDADIYHLHIHPRFAKQDLDCVLPLRRLQVLRADGIVGGVASTHYSFIGLRPLTPTPGLLGISALPGG
jgi:hypothetical protein